MRKGELWAIPTKDQNRWAEGEGRWVTTGAVRFGELSEDLNQSASSPRVGDRPAYKPSVKLVRQIRETHLGDRRPGGLYLEFVTFEAWRSRLVAGSEWDTLLAHTLKCIAERFDRAEVDPLLDPVLHTPLDPPLSVDQIKQAAAIFGKLAASANRALLMNNTDAATEWREILGGNDRANPVLPYPPNSGGRVGSAGRSNGSRCGRWDRGNNSAEGSPPVRIDQMEQESFDIASLEGFRADLVASGFEPVSTTERRMWRGPIHSAFEGLTDASTMEVVFDPGWPYRPPRVYVQDLNTNHSTLDGFVCLWREGDASLQWETVDGLFGRIEDWCVRAKNGWQDDDLPFDAYLNFVPKWSLMATFDFESLRTNIGGWGDIHGVRINPNLLNLRPGPATRLRELRGLWFRVGQLQAPPPRNLSELPQHLKRPQRKGLAKALSRRRSPQCSQPLRSVEIILFGWQRRERTDLLIMAIKGIGGNVEAGALLAEPNDQKTLMLRAGPDAEILKKCRAVLFGVGALGGHVAVTLAESGIEHLRIVDSDFLSPGNVVRHVAGHDQVGVAKVKAVEAVIRNHAPWTEVDSTTPPVNPSGRKEITQLVMDADVVIDATGNDAFVYPVAQVAEDLGKPLVSGALLRGGSIGRVQRKALDIDAPINSRPDSPDYPNIPPGDSTVDLAEPALGCSAPVNNAPPSSVLACASLMVQATIDVITERFEFEDEVIDVYRPLPNARFDHVGRYGRPGQSAPLPKFSR